MHIAIVSNTLMTVDVLRRVLGTIPEYKVIWSARNGMEAVEKCSGNPPNLILLDLITPVQGAMQAIRTIMEEFPCAILVVTDTSFNQAARVFEAMGHGALDAVYAPAPCGGGRIQGAEALLKKIALVGKLLGRTPPGQEAALSVSRSCPGNVPPLVVMGASTGGPRVLAEILAGLPPDFEAPVVVVQHVDVQFAGRLAHWLDERTPLRVTLAAEGQRPVRGNVYMAGTNDHLVLGQDLALHYTPEPRNTPYKPSVDMFLLSVERYWPQPGAAVLLTGMGKDGAKGLLALRQAEWHTITQDESTSIVYGMPRTAAEMGAAVEVLPFLKIAESLIHVVRNGIPLHTSKERPDFR